MKTIGLRILITALVFLAWLPVITFAAKKHDVQAGMDFANAMESVRDCIELASGITRTKIKSNDSRKSDGTSREVSKIRPNDTLESVGIWDEFSLTALRRFLVHNEDCGVQRYFGVGEAQIVARSYIINEGVLSSLTRKKTVAEVAEIVAKNAGRPFLPHAIAARIVSNCRAQSLLSTMPGMELKQIKTSSKVRADLGANPAEQKIRDFSAVFSNCLTGSDFGIGSAGVTFPKDGEKSYELPLGASGYVDKLITSDSDLTYYELVDYVYSNSLVVPPGTFITDGRLKYTKFINVVLLIGGKNAPQDSRLFRVRDFLTDHVVNTAFKKQPLTALGLTPAAFECGLEELNKLQKDAADRPNELRTADKLKPRATVDCRNSNKINANPIVTGSMTLDQILAAI